MKEYNVSESDGYLEVCIKLASTGDQKSLTASVEANVTFVDNSATGMYEIVIDGYTVEPF